MADTPDNDETRRIDPFDGDDSDEQDDPNQTRKIDPFGKDDQAAQPDPNQTRKLDPVDDQQDPPADPNQTRILDTAPPTIEADTSPSEVEPDPGQTQRRSGWRAPDETLSTRDDPKQTQPFPAPPPPPAPEPTVEIQRPKSKSGWQPPPSAPKPAPAHLQPRARRQIQPPAPPTRKPQPRPRQTPAPVQKTVDSSFWLSFRRAFFIMAIIFLVGCAALAAIGTAGYVYLAAQLPPPEELTERATQLFTSSQIYDKNGNLLFELLDPQGGRRTVVEIEDMSIWLRQALIDTEDPRFYRHPGFDPIGIVRAVLQNLRAGSTVSGASTIAQQLVRNLLLPPEERTEISASRKIKEIVLAAEVTRRYERDFILELYLNSAYFGNLAYGAQAAAETYFQKDASDLTLAEGSFIAGLVQAPAVYDAFTPDGREAALARHRIVLRLMIQAGSITPEESADAILAMEAYEFKQSRIAIDIPSPHFVQYVRQIVEAQFGPEALYRGGLKIHTTLDPHLQELAQSIVREQVYAIAERNVHGGALVALEPSSGRVLAMVGSPDYNDDDYAGQINMAAVPRQTGSAIKPLTYLGAFEKGWTPATVIWDVKTEYPDFSGNVYAPVNYDGRFHGPQSVRSSIANSYNIPAVKTLEFLGIPDFLEIAQRFGITTFTRPDYGLSITLGAGEAPLIEMVGAFQVFANGGRRMPPFVIERITNVRGDVQCQFTPPGQDSGGIEPCERNDATGQQVISPQHAFLLTDIMSDNRARCSAFGCPNLLEIGRPAAVKTGTTNDFRDNWTIGYSPELLVGVWVGNPDRSEMRNVSGVSGAGPIWNNFMRQALADQAPTNFARPSGIIELEVCAVSGTQPTQYCPDRRSEIFAADQPAPGPERDWFQLLRIDAASGLIYVDGCAGGVIEKVMVVVPEEGYEWAQQNGYEVAPMDACTAASTTTVVALNSPANGQRVTGLVSLVGTVQMANFERYELQFGAGAAPSEWRWISGPHLAQVVDSQLTTWNTNDLEAGEYTLRLTAYAQGGGSIEARASVIVDHGATPVPSDTPGPTSTDTLIPTDTPLVAPTLPPSSDTPIATPTPESSPTPDASPTFSPTESPPEDTPLPTDEPPPSDTPEPTATTDGG